MLFNRYAGKEITSDDDGVRYLLMREAEVLGVVTGDHEIRPGYIEPRDFGVQSLPGDAR